MGVLDRPVRPLLGRGEGSEVFRPQRGQDHDRPPAVVAQRLGHASPALTLSIYSHVLPRQQLEAATAFARLVEVAQPTNTSAARCPGCGHERVDWSVTVHGGGARLADSLWFAADFVLRSGEADMVLQCPECGWSKTVAAREWEAR